MPDWTVVTEPLQILWHRLIAFVPNFLGALVILFIGWLVAKGIRWVITEALTRIKVVEMISEKAGVAAALARGGITISVSELIGVFGYWFIMLVVFIAALNALNLTVAAQLLDQMVLYLPNVVAAVFILLLGSFFASFLATAIRTATSNAGFAQSAVVGSVVQWIVLIFAIVAALEQLKVGVIVARTFEIVLMAVGLAVALSFGLGCKEIAGKAVDDYLQRLKSQRRR